MEKFLLLRLTVRFGVPAAVILAFACSIITFWILFYSITWVAIAPAVFAGLLVFAAAKSYVELIVLITDMLLPR